MRKLLLAAHLVLLAVAPALLVPAPASAQAPQVDGTGAFGYYANVSLFGGPPNRVGPAPTVTLPMQGETRYSATLPEAKAQFGPAVLMQSGEEKVVTSVKPGATPTVTSSAAVTGTRDGPGPIFYDKVTSTCTARGSSLGGSVTLSGRLATSTFVAPDPHEGDPKDVEPLPAKPPPNFERFGEISNVGDRFRVVFNEQVRDGASLTVNAVHMYLLGPIAVGDLVIGHARCEARGPSGPGERQASTGSSPVFPLLVAGSVVAVAGGFAGSWRSRRRRGRARPIGDGGR